MKSKAGGRIHSRQVVREGVRTGKGNYGVNPGYPSQLGNKIGAHATNAGDLKPKPEPMHANAALQTPKHGNEVALNVGKGGPGAGRTTDQVAMLNMGQPIREREA